MDKERVHVVASIHHGLGDVVMAVPTLVGMERKCGNRLTLTLLVKSGVEEKVLQLIPWKEKPTIISLGHQGRWNHRQILRTAWRLRLAHPDVYLAIHSAPSFSTSVFAHILGAKLSVGPGGRRFFSGFRNCVVPGPTQHKVQYYHEFASLAGLSNEPATLNEIVLSDSAQSKTKKVLQKLGGAQRHVILVPGSSGIETHKRWSLEKWRKLMMDVLENDASLGVILLGSPSERPLLDNVLGESSLSRIQIVSQGRIDVAASIIQKASCLVTCCTGPGHLAALLGTPLVTIYGPTNPSITGPYTKSMRVVRLGMECSPCYRQGFETGCGEPFCMSDISVDRVLQEVFNVLQGERFPEIPVIRSTMADHHSKN